MTEPQNTREALEVADSDRPPVVGTGGPDVAFVTAIVPSYKVWVYEALGRRFPGRFFAVHGTERKGTVPVDVGPVKHARDVKTGNRYLVVGGIEFTWIPAVWWYMKNRPSVVILQDGVRILSNYAIHFLARVLRRRVLYYGHGFNHQAGRDRHRLVAELTETIRRWYLQASDGAIVYSEAGRSALLRSGVNAPIYVARNTIDTHRASREMASLGEGDLARVRGHLDVQTSDRVIVTLGRLVPSKRIDAFVRVIREMNVLDSEHGYVGVVIGDGPLRESLEALARHSCIRFTGFLGGRDLREVLAISDLMLLSGSVGLAIVESFCAGLPFVALESDTHGPEIEYLHHGENGLLLAPEPPEALARRLVELLDDEEMYARLKLGAKASASLLSASDMLGAFFDAIKGFPPSQANSTSTPPSTSGASLTYGDVQNASERRTPQSPIGHGGSSRTKS